MATKFHRDIIVNELRGVEHEINLHVKNAYKLIELSNKYNRVYDRVHNKRINNGVSTLLDHLCANTKIFSEISGDYEDNFEASFSSLSHAIERWASAKSAKNDTSNVKRAKSDEYAAAVIINDIVHVFSNIETVTQFEEYSNHLTGDWVVLTSMCMQLLETIPASDDVARDAIDCLMESTRVNLRRSGCATARNVDSDKFMRIFWPYVADRWICKNDDDVSIH